MKKKILIIVSHPDDEILGCGGALNFHLKNKDKVYIYFTHEGSSARFTSVNDPKVFSEIKKRKDAAIKLAKDFKYQIVGFGNNVNLNIDKIDHLKNVKIISKVINSIKPDIIYTHFFDDLNPDHNMTHKFVISACRPVDYLVKEIYLIEIPSSTDWNLINKFNPDTFIKIDIKKKHKMLKYYQSEMRQGDHSRSKKNIESLATYRGGQVGLNFSEAFITYRKITF